MRNLTQDIRYAARMLLKNPGMSAIVIFTLAVGIGANTALFSAMNAFLLRPLPVANADRLMVIAPMRHGETNYTQFSYLDFQDLRKQTGAFSDVLAYNINLVGISTNDKAQQVVVTVVSGNYFQALGLKPVLGRFISGDAADKQGAAPEIVLGYSYWKQRFDSDPTIVGQQVKMNGRLATIIGIAPENFHGLYSMVDSQAYLPLGLPISDDSKDNKDDFWTKRDARALKVLGILKPGIDQKQAQSSVDVVMQRLGREYPNADQGVTARVVPERLSRPEPDPDNSLVLVATVFMALAGLVLLLACTNVVNILLVRATAREREMAVRSALGAARTRLVRQLMTESLLLSFLGGVGGMLLGSWASVLLGSIHMTAAGMTLLFDFGFDWRVFSYGMLAAILTGIIVGMAPAWRASRLNINSVLHEGSRGVVAGTGRSRVRRLLVAGQIAVSLVLLVVAGLFLRSSQNAERVFWGFDPHHVLNVAMTTRALGFDQAKSQQFYRDLEDRIKVLPGVESVSSASSVPMGYYGNGDSFFVEGANPDNKQSVPDVSYNSVDLEYFSTMRVSMVSGRRFTENDTEESPKVAIVNETLARRFWPNQDPLGKRFSIKAAGGPFIQVVGVAKNGKYQNPWEDPLEFYFVPRLQNYKPLRAIQIRTSGDPAALTAQVLQQVHDLAPELPVFDVQTMEQALEGVNGLFFIRMATRLTIVLGMLGLLLAIVGVYGVVSYSASQRTHEIGVRMAMGASRADILRMVLKQGFSLVGFGVVAGLVLTFVTGRAVSNMLVGVSPSDPLTLALVTVLLSSISLIASLIPARRAMKVEPLKALRSE